MNVTGVFFNPGFRCNQTAKVKYTSFRQERCECPWYRLAKVNPLEAIRNQPSLFMDASTKKKKKRKGIERTYSSCLFLFTMKISIGYKDFTGWWQWNRLARQRFRIILRSVQPNSRVLEMPEIRHSKRFEYLRVSSRVILPLLYANILPYDCWIRECETWRALLCRCRVSHFCGHSLPRWLSRHVTLFYWISSNFLDIL